MKTRTPKLPKIELSVHFGSMLKNVSVVPIASLLLLATPAVADPIAVDTNAGTINGIGSGGTF